MRKFSIKNSSNDVLQIRLEPWLDELTLDPGKEAEVRGDFGDGLEGIEFELWPDNFVSISVPAGTRIVQS
jgi:hypothetical protein